MGKSQSKGSFFSCSSLKNSKEISKGGISSEKNITTPSNNTSNLQQKEDLAVKNYFISDNNPFYQIQNFKVTHPSKIKTLNSTNQITRDDSTELSNTTNNFHENYLQQPQKKYLSLKLFEKIRVIGRGTFGKVILTKSKETNELFALKCLKKQYIIKTGQVKNLKNEKSILNKLDHPFIIKLKFSFQDEDKIYLGFEYFNGGELFFHLSKFKKFPEQMAKFYLAEIYLALSHLHKNNIFYRDMKPENIILDSEGHVKLIDFGLAKEIINDVGTESFCGTNEYIPPEVLAGRKYGNNFDWWGFGVIMYELLFGRPPFTDENKHSLFRKILKEEPVFDAVQISYEALNLIKSLLKKDPNKRINPKEIPQHPFFSGVNFDEVLMKKVKPPFKPKVKNEMDLNNIDPHFLYENIDSPVKKQKCSSGSIDQSKIGF